MRQILKISQLCFLVFVLLVCLSSTSRADSLPVLKQASEISTGKLPDGIRYYIVTNPSSKGYANFALVQKGRADKDAARVALASLPHFQKCKPYEFLASKGIGYTRKGYVRFQGQSAIYDFENVPVFESAASDSTLLMLFDIASGFNGEQAIIVSGDITQKALADRMYTMSLAVGVRGNSPIEPPYVWDPSKKLQVAKASNSTSGVGTVSLSFSAPRTPYAQMNTLQPLVSQMYAKELGYILTRRVEKSFHEASIPFVATRFRHRDSAASAADETYSFSVSTDKNKLKEATKILASIISNIDTWGVGADEFRDAKDRLNTEAKKEIGRRNYSNATFVEKCISAYLYGSNLAAPSTINQFFSSKVMEADREVELFNNFIAALFDREKGATLRFASPDSGLDSEMLAQVFRKSWDAAAKEALFEKYTVGYGDTLSLYKAKGGVQKVKSSTPEPVTGGQLWTFSGGMKVIFKDSGKSGEFNYALMTRGGYASVPGLIAGESAFVPDMMSLMDVAGMNAMDWRNMLTANGITMKYDVSLSDMRIFGSAPSSKLQLLLKALVSLSTNRKVNRKTFDFYKSGEELRQELEKVSQQGINTVIDSIMCPDFFYSRTKSMRCLRDDLPERTEEYFKDQFSQMGDGVLVLIGDLGEATTQKILGKYIGGFNVGEGFSVRPKVQYQLRSGWSTYTIDGAKSLVGTGEPCVNVAMASLMPFSISSYMSFKVAVSVLRKSIVKALAPLGMYAEVNERIEIFPKEKVTVFVNCKPCRADGLPDGVAPADPLSALGVLRSAISQACYSKISDSDLKGYKESLTNRMASEIAVPENLVNYALMRNSEGKDLISNYAGHIKSVTAQKVQEILKQLDGGCKVEYVIK